MAFQYYSERNTREGRQAPPNQQDIFRQLLESLGGFPGLPIDNDTQGPSPRYSDLVYRPEDAPQDRHTGRPLPTPDSDFPAGDFISRLPRETYDRSQPPPVQMLGGNRNREVERFIQLLLRQQGDNQSYGNP